MYVLDTSIVSEIRKSKTGRADPAVVEWSSRVPTGLTYISAITIQELEHGVLLAERRDPTSGAVLRHWLDGDVASAFEQRILPVDTTVARLAASLHVPDPAPIIDALIAATALANGMTVVTLNTRDFERFDQLQVLRPR
ncbi:MAG: type II toxin-antitoxin system VapC family toxin [Gemmatimonadetes bacterium]|nr:type II toxin-antitoxin system VapC family toxin [Acidimicrobiia bacterium]MYE73385.1 type II toxin-antitoxin system VapC family toxin [Acidimicrobiia bacterium]MYJ12447.1 type II toxin-antitoxin system VapC family toxin [Gemmatimonadota bacterium]